jgi:hypothetical protein
VFSQREDSAAPRGDKRRAMEELISYSGPGIETEKGTRIAAYPNWNSIPVAETCVAMSGCPRLHVKCQHAVRRSVPQRHKKRRNRKMRWMVGTQTLAGFHYHNRRALIQQDLRRVMLPRSSQRTPKHTYDCSLGRSHELIIDRKAPGWHFV